MPARKLKEFLNREGVQYTSVQHSPAYTAQEEAESSHVGGKEFAKTVIVDLDGRMAMAVLPADRKVVLQDLRDITGSDRVKFASEEDFAKHLPDCEKGALPPFGNLYGMEVFVAEALARNPEIAFNAGTHTETIRMSFADFERLVHPKIMSFTT